MEIEYEEKGINTKNEKSLHADIKRWYAMPGDRFEVKVGQSVVDIVRGELLIEVQTGNFSAISKKLERLCKEHPVRLIYPVPQEKWIVRTSREGEVLSRRKSPKKGAITDVFRELIRIPKLMNNPNLSLQVLLISMEEIWCDDGMGSWRRKGVSIADKILLSVNESVVLYDHDDFKTLLPNSLPEVFSNKMLSKEMKVPIAMARKISYCLRKMEIIEQCGKKSNELLFKINNPSQLS